MFRERYFRARGVAAAVTVCVWFAATVSGADAGPRAVPAGTIVVLHSFAGADGENPQGGLQYVFKIAAGKLITSLYGATQSGGDANGDGTIFSQGVLKTAPFSTVFTFDGSDGSTPSGGLSGFGNDYPKAAKIFGVTANGGSHGLGAIYQALPNGAQAVLYSFTGWGDGANPIGRLIFKDGFLYGTTSAGALGYGTVFRYSLQSRRLSTLHAFTNGNDGGVPLSGLTLRLTIPSTEAKARQAARSGRAIDALHADHQYIDANLYGTTSIGGAGGLGNGTVFKISPNGTLTTLVVFTDAVPGSGGIPGATPQAELATDYDGNLYGSTFTGGSAGLGEVFEYSARGQFAVLHDFAYDAIDGTEPTGANPLAPVTVLFDGTVYGTTSSGSSDGLGNVFEIGSGGFTLKYEFTGPDGASPQAPLVDGLDGNLYSTTFAGGLNGYGEIFAIGE